MPTIAAIDVDYRDDKAVAACVVFDAWDASDSSEEKVMNISSVEPYVSGQFYRREMPCILAVLGKLSTKPDVVIVDGFVWLGDPTKPGLGGHLWEALGRRKDVVGVAKNAFAGAAPIREVYRGTSKRPLYVGAAGCDLDSAALNVSAMHGDHRLPTLLRRVDRLCRQ